MSAKPGILQRLGRRLPNISISARIVIGNSIIIFIGAVGGTLLARYLTSRGISLAAILLLALAGLFFSVLVNLWIVRSALQPFMQLRQYIDRLRPEMISDARFSLTNPDPDTTILASTLSSLIDQLESRERQLHAISEQAIHAQEEERLRIARSLHDDTGQSLSSLIINLERLENHIPADDAKTRQDLIASRQLARDTLNELRVIIHDLRPSILDDLGLIPSIRWYARKNLGDAGIRVDLHLPDEPLNLPNELNTTLFRIAQETINNIVRHSQARRAKISLIQDSREIILRVEDDGLGFYVAGDQGEAIRMHQWGLVGIQERIELVGGSFDLSSEPGSGTCVCVRVPIPETVEAFNG